MLANGPAISIKDLRKRYEKTEALKGISFDIQPGEFFGFLGPNGAGKTTTINLITGLANVTEGRISVFGLDVVKDYRDSRRLIGLASQEPNFDPFFPLHKVLTFQAGYHGVPGSLAKDRAKQLLKRFGLWEHRQKTSRQISGGMKRRLLIAKALVHDPEILILDEPTAGVDVELRHHLWGYLKELNDEGKTIMLTTHYIEEAEELCNRIGIIHLGEMRALEEKSALMSQLAEKEVVISVDKLTDEMRAALPKEAGFTAKNNSVRFETEGSTARLAKVMQLITAAGATVTDIDVHALDLEDIFVQLTNDTTSPDRS